MWRTFEPLARLLEHRKRLQEAKKRIASLERDHAGKEQLYYDAKQNFELATKEHQEIQKVLTQKKLELDRLQIEIKELDAEEHTLAENKTQNGVKERQTAAALEQAKTALSGGKAKKKNASESLTSYVEDAFPGPEKTIFELNSGDDASDSTHLHALGDLHGWAPGLINYLTKHNLAKIEISGTKVYNEVADGKIVCDLDAMASLFPDLNELAETIGENGGDTEELKSKFSHAGLLGHKAGDLDPKVVYCQVEAKWVGGQQYFIQVGDIFDRADHSELAAEIMRQLLLQAPSHVFVLVGNHEEFLLCDQYGGWSRNETKWDWDREKGGNTRTRFTEDGLTKHDILGSMYKKYQQSASMLYLTQYFAKMAVSHNPTNLLPWLKPKEITDYSKAILGGGWDGYKAAQKLHEQILKQGKNGQITYPGAIAAFGLGDTWFMHGEPNGLKAYLSDLNSKQKEQLTTPVRIGGRNVLIMSMGLKEDGDRYSSPNSELFWARGAMTGHEGIASKFAHLTAPILEVLPGVRNIVHGHSPVPNEVGENKPYTYLGRLIGAEVSPTNGQIRVYNIDEGITPVYQIVMKPRDRIGMSPTGLRVPSELASLHESGDLIDEDDLWVLSHMYVEADASEVYTISKKLLLCDVPDSYKKAGPGQISIDASNYAEPHFICTTQDEFRQNPVSFSWLNIRRHKAMTLTKKSPARDGIYRIQHLDHSSPQSLSKNMMNALEVEAFADVDTMAEGEPYKGSHSVRYLERVRTSDFMTDRMRSEGIMHDASEAGVHFASLRSTSSANQLNISFLNMGAHTVTVEVKPASPSPDSETFSATHRLIIKPLHYIVTSVKSFFASPVCVHLQIHGEEEWREIFSGVFGPNDIEPIPNTNRIEAQPFICSINGHSPSNVNVAEILSNKTVSEPQVSQPMAPTISDDSLKDAEQEFFPNPVLTQLDHPVSSPRENLASNPTGGRTSLIAAASPDQGISELERPIEPAVEHVTPPSVRSDIAKMAEPVLGLDTQIKSSSTSEEPTVALETETKEPEGAPSSKEEAVDAVDTKVKGEFPVDSASESEEPTVALETETKEPEGAPSSKEEAVDAVDTKVKGESPVDSASESEEPTVASETETNPVDAVSSKKGVRGANSKLDSSKVINSNLGGVSDDVVESEHEGRERKEKRTVAREIYNQAPNRNQATSPDNDENTSLPKDDGEKATEILKKDREEREKSS